METVTGGEHVETEAGLKRFGRLVLLNGFDIKGVVEDFESLCWYEGDSEEVEPGEEEQSEGAEHCSVSVPCPSVFRRDLPGSYHWTGRCCLGRRRWG